MKARHILTAAMLCLSGCGPSEDIRSAPGHPAIPDKFHALGTEPFWSLTVDRMTARYSTPEIPETAARDVARSTAPGSETMTGRIGELAFTLTVWPESCNDGMSDRVYPFAVRLRMGGTDLQGCAAQK